MATADDIVRIRKEVINGSCHNPDVAVISAHELQRMKHESVILTKAELIAHQKIEAEQLEQQNAKALAKKKRMIELEQEKKKTDPILSDIEREDLEKQGASRKKAEEFENENRDEVKKMNQMVTFSLIEDCLCQVCHGQRQAGRGAQEDYQREG